VLESSRARWSLTSASVLKLLKLDGPVLETRLSGLVVIMSWSQLLSWPFSSLPKPCSALLPPPLDSSQHRASLHYWPKIHSLALPSSECLPADQQKTHWVSPTLVGDQVLLLLPGKPDGPVWHSGLSNFPTPRPFCLAGG
jgi:hypothetical protein